MLQVQDLRVIYNRVVRVLDGISFEVPAGRMVALLGANGAGKSTTLKAVSGMLRSDGGAVASGRVLLEGRTVTGYSAVRMVRLGVMHVMEGRFLFPDLTVKENLEMGAYSQKDRRRIAKDLAQWLEFFPRLAERRSTPAGYLSGGEQQMLAIARALMSHPRMVLLDEPSMGLSPLLVREVFRIIRQIQQSQGLAFLLVEQNVKLALEIASYGYVLEQGCIRIEGTSDELKQNKHLQDFYLGINGNETVRCKQAAPQ
ncbi:MAG: ABC transporter ATP-binding protein [Proteobacteria bacterium]|nr:ABC transporter ATP-binding protein [Pseudomonadota bacterium]MBU4276326.1 ABC transporter ATP-binding protein [Pseudomonadota bacterium]MBU4383665.1 ABC transporter ATP-binding protein [Pseudomonadota bacterium]MBU4606250.1 ABC transporter ATP-binding protein [Pseudomonadota bacterium]MCG2763889.1 ABC transporter ATP-binding protein [Desulfarculaceae bacterium]